MSGLLGAGDLYFNRIVNGASVGYDWLGNVTQFALQEPTEEKIRPSKGRNDRGTALDTVYIKQPATMAFAFDEVQPANLELALLGDRSTVNEGAGSLTDVAVTAKLDKWQKIPGYRNIVASGLTVQDVTDTTTYALGTDYEINFVTGMIKALSTGDISANEVLHIDGTSFAVSGTKVVAGTNQVLRGAFLLDGKNLADDSPIIVTVPYGVVSPNSPIDFLADDFTNVSFNGRPVKLPGAETAWYVEQLTLATA
jgi:hypothetical protein